MCGIVGYCGDFDASRLEPASELLAHRGPDGAGVWASVEEGVGLAHRRLAIIDPSPAGAQPMLSDDGRVIIVYNGEVYNYRELRKELKEKGERFRGHSDTEVILKLYCRQGKEMLKSLQGIFALAIWDRRSRELLLARDRLGVKPLYVAPLGRGLVFGSEIKAMLELHPIPRDIDFTALSHYLTYLWCPAPRTPLKHVRKVTPGTAMTVRQGRVTAEWNFTGSEVTDAPTVQCVSASTLTTRVREVIESAVSRQLIADVPVGAFLSGGLDSSAVVAFAIRHYKGEKFECFTIAYDDSGDYARDMTADLPFAKLAAQVLGAPLNVVHVRPDIVGDLARMIYFLDEPQADFAALNTYYISRYARDRGIKVLLSGAGGDDIFTGYRRHLAVNAARRMDWLPRPLVTGLAYAAKHGSSRNTALRRIRKFLDGALTDKDTRGASYFQWLSPMRSRSLFVPDLRREIEVEDPLVARLGIQPEHWSDLRRVLDLEQRFFLADHNLPYTDKMSMAASVETRVPLLDESVVRLGNEIPDNLKIRRGTTKWIFKKAMEGVLPREIIYRPKTGFGVPLRAWFQGPLAGAVDKVLSPSAVAERGWFVPDRVQELVRADRNGEVDAAYSILALICVELWAQMFVDGVSPEGIGANIGDWDVRRGISQAGQVWHV